VPPFYPPRFRAIVAILALFAATLPAFADQQSMAALIDEILTRSNAQAVYGSAVRTVLEQSKLTFKLQRDAFERQMQPPRNLSDEQRAAKKKELDAVFDEFETSINDTMRKAVEWEAVKKWMAAAYDDLFTEDELAGMAAFFRTPVGEAYAKKMPDLTARTSQLGKEAAQSLKPEIFRLAQLAMAKAIVLGYTFTPKNAAQIPAGVPPPASGSIAPGTPGFVPGAMAGGVIGGIIGSVPTEAIAPAPPPSQLDSAPPGINRIRIGGNVQQAKLIQQPKPVYPPLAKQARISGVVKLNAIIGKDGAVQNLTVASGHPLLVPAAMEAVKHWVYQPTLMNGAAVEVITQIEVNFTLSQDGPPAGQVQAAAGDSLAKVVELGDMPTLRARLAAGANPNETDDAVVKGWTPLMAAADAGNVDAARLLLDSGAALDAKTQQGSTALDIAMRSGKAQVAEFLRGWRK